MKEVKYAGNSQFKLPKYVRKPSAKKELAGVDLFVHWQGTNADELADKMKKIQLKDISLKMITNRGIKVWPEGFEETFCTDHWRCRFNAQNEIVMENSHILELLQNALNEQIDIIKTENLYLFNGVPAYSLGQGQ